jgi:2-polyprenyl-3-methyl-5-hydroxy-6-metoxy-1,4-benzoquinol methylase
MKIFPINFSRYTRFILRPFMSLIHRSADHYFTHVSKGEIASISKHPNERILEYSFVLKSISRISPNSVLDVGPGLSSFPHLLMKCDLKVTAIDNFSNYWDKGVFNRHFQIIDSKIEEFKCKEVFDLVYCISTLEHIPNSDEAISAMFALIPPGGHLALTIPYSELAYDPNIYLHPNATFGSHVNYICQVFSREQIDGWLSQNNAEIIEQEYWKIYSGEMHTFGESIYPFESSKKDELHQLTCILFKKKFD